MWIRMTYSWAFLLALALPTFGITGSKTSIYSGFLGCRFSRSLCRKNEICVDDSLFGNCQRVGRSYDDYKYSLSTSQLSSLESELKRLVSLDYRWDNPYVQCVLGNILLAYRMRRDFDPSFCVSGGRSSQVDEDRLINEARRILMEYMLSNGVSQSEEYVGSEGAWSDPWPSAEKKDELVQIHKYQKSRKRQDWSSDDVDSLEYTDWLPESREESDGDLLAAILDQLLNHPDYNSLPKDYVTDYPTTDVSQEPSIEEGNYEEESFEQADTMSRRDSQLLGSLLQGDLDVSELSNREVTRLLRYVDMMLKALEVNMKKPPNNEDGIASETADEVTNDISDDGTDDTVDHISENAEEGDLWDDVVDNNGEDDVDVNEEDGTMSENDSPEDSPAEKRVPKKQGIVSADPVPTSKPIVDIVDANYGTLIVKPKQWATEEDAAWFLTKLSEMLNIDPDIFSEISWEDGRVNFHVDSDVVNASYVTSMALKNAAELNDVTGYLVTDRKIGEPSKQDEVPVGAVEGREEAPKYFVLTFALCGVIAGGVLAVIAIYVVRRHAHSKEKLAQIASTTVDAPQASSDYQDLCRQRMQSKSSEKPEPIHVASRVGSVSATEAAVRSPSSRSSTSSWSEEPVNSNMDISTGHMVLSYMEDHLKNRDRLEQEWQALVAYEAEPNDTSVATQPANTRKNRYTDILAYDHSRVVLASATNVSGSDYTNACTIMDHDPRNPAYIATQGPLPHTVADFWQMVWEQGSVVIVNLTRLTEDGVAMCHRYWPEEGSDLYHIYEVHLVSEHIWCEDYLVRSFYLKNLQTNETRTVTQFHFLTWPDLGIPATAKALLDFRRKVNKSYRGRSCPVIVHCSDGVGRTGTYMLIDMVLNRMGKGAKEIDIAATLEHIRDQRMQMVKVKEQFEFALAAVAEEVHAILKALPQ